jgi:hypothetical protein
MVQATGCPVDIGILDPSINSNPFPTYERMLAEKPIYFDPAVNFYIVSRYEDRSLNSSSAIFAGPLHRLWPTSQIPSGALGATILRQVPNICVEAIVCFKGAELIGCPPMPRFAVQYLPCETPRS